MTKQVFPTDTSPTRTAFVIFSLGKDEMIKLTLSSYALKYMYTYLDAKKTAKTAIQERVQSDKHAKRAEMLF